MAALFSVANLLVLPFWLLMIALPRWRWTERILRSPLVAVPPAVLYAALVLPRLPELLPAVANPTLADIAALLGTDQGATVAWLHFLAFDLLIGRWAYLDGRLRGLSLWLMAPLLLLILLLGPLGFLLYLGARALPLGGSSRAPAARPGAAL